MSHVVVCDMVDSIVRTRKFASSEDKDFKEFNFYSCRIKLAKEVVDLPKMNTWTHYPEDKKYPLEIEIKNALTEQVIERWRFDRRIIAQQNDNLQYPTTKTLNLFFKSFLSLLHILPAYEHCKNFNQNEILISLDARTENTGPMISKAMELRFTREVLSVTYEYTERLRGRNDVLIIEKVVPNVVYDNEPIHEVPFPNPNLDLSNGPAPGGHIHLCDSDRPNPLNSSGGPIAESNHFAPCNSVEEDDPKSQLTPHNRQLLDSLFDATFPLNCEILEEKESIKSSLPFQPLPSVKKYTPQKPDLFSFLPDMKQFEDKISPRNVPLDDFADTLNYLDSLKSIELKLFENN